MLPRLGLLRSRLITVLINPISGSQPLSFINLCLPPSPDQRGPALRTRVKARRWGPRFSAPIPELSGRAVLCSCSRVPSPHQSFTLRTSLPFPRPNVARRVEIVKKRAGGGLGTHFVSIPMLATTFRSAYFIFVRFSPPTLPLPLLILLLRPSPPYLFLAILLFFFPSYFFSLSLSLS